MDLIIDSSGTTKYSSNDAAGFQLWRKFDTVVILDETVRFQLDTEWGLGCQQARIGNWTPQFLELINDRVLPASSSFQWQNQQFTAAFESVRRILDGSRDVDGRLTGKATQFVTPDNETRTLLNNRYITCAATALPRGHYPIRIVANFHHSLDDQSPGDVNNVMSMFDARTSRLAPYLDLVPGMPIVFTHNVNTGLGIANGTFGNLYDVQFPDDTRFRLVEDAGTGLQVLVANKFPLVVLVTVDRGDIEQMPKPTGSTLPDNVFSVFMQRASRSVEVPLTPGLGGEKRSRRVSMTHCHSSVPPAQQCTRYKARL